MGFSHSNMQSWRVNLHGGWTQQHYGKQNVKSSYSPLIKKRQFQTNDLLFILLFCSFERANLLGRWKLLGKKENINVVLLGYVSVFLHMLPKCIKFSPLHTLYSEQTSRTNNANATGKSEKLRSGA